MSTNEDDPIMITLTHTLGPWEDCVGGERSAVCHWQPSDDVAAEVDGCAWYASAPPGDERAAAFDVVDSPEAARAAAMAYLRGLVVPTQDGDPIQTSYTRAQLAAAVDEAHQALHEIDGIGEVSSSADDWILRSGPLRDRAHAALHRVGAGMPRVGCATADPEAQSILSDLIRIRDNPAPCGHAIGNLILTGPPGRTVTKCGECLAVNAAAKASGA